VQGSYLHERGALTGEIGILRLGPEFGTTAGSKDQGIGLQGKERKGEGVIQRSNAEERDE